MVETKTSLWRLFHEIEHWWFHWREKKWPMGVGILGTGVPTFPYTCKTENFSADPVCSDITKTRNEERSQMSSPSEWDPRSPDQDLKDFSFFQHSPMWVCSVCENSLTGTPSNLHKIRFQAGGSQEGLEPQDALACTHVFTVSCNSSPQTIPTKGLPNCSAGLGTSGILGAPDSPSPALPWKATPRVMRA